MMRILFLCIWMIVLIPTCYAVDYRWYPNSGSNQGFLEANIQNKDGSLFIISCGYFREDHMPGMDWETHKFRLSGIKTLQIVVDETSYPFTASFFYSNSLKRSDATFAIDNLATYTVLKGLVGALVRSRAPEFTIEVPQDRLSEVFSLVGAREILLGKRFEDTPNHRSVPNGHTIADPCVGDINP